MKTTITGILLAVAIAFSPADARATTILPNCGTCGAHNTAWDLTLALINDAQNTYQLTVTATYGSPRDFIWINDISFKIDAFKDNYDSSPTVTSGPIEALGWSVVAGGISSGGCHPNSNNGFFCAKSNFLGATGLAGSTDTWVFLMSINNSLPNFASGSGTFKAQFTDLFGNQVGSLLSEDVTFGTTNGTLPPPTVPEPATLALFGAGLAATATAIRRRRKA